MDLTGGYEGPGWAKAPSYRRKDDAPRAEAAPAATASPITIPPRVAWDRDSMMMLRTNGVGDTDLQNRVANFLKPRRSRLLFGTPTRLPKPGIS